jgi:4-amino-4-deoxy-L-arabinose transferase-like glycosyltransferase
MTLRAIPPQATAPPPAEIEEDGLLPHLRWPLLIAVLTVQAVLSLHLAWSNTAYTDEAAYLWAGHLEIAHLLHGAPVPAFQSWFSGAPAIYPPVGAIADAIGGLTAARTLSLAFMIGATALLWSTTSRLFGLRAAFFAAGLFAVLGPTQFQGALATYDALALLMVAASVWCVVAAQDHRDSTVLLIAGIGLLALANATKYATVLFDPVVIILAALVVAEKRGRKAALGRGGYFAASVIAIIAALLTIGGSKYVTGLLSTTLARAAGHDSPFLVLADSFKLAGAAGLLALAGVIIGWRRETRAQTLVLATLTAAWVLAPLNQARLETITSLPKNVDFGAWLAAPAAGYALAELTVLIRRRELSRATAGLIAVIVLGPAASLGWAQASNLFRGWPDFSQAITSLRTQTQQYPGNYLAEDDDVPAYYLRGSVPWQRWSNTWYFGYTLTGGRQLVSYAAFSEAIRRHYFALVILDYNSTPRTDAAIVNAMSQAGGYGRVARVPTSLGHCVIWAYRPDLRRGH